MTTVKTVVGIFGSNILSHRLEKVWILWQWGRKHNQECEPVTGLDNRLPQQSEKMARRLSTTICRHHRHKHIPSPVLNVER